MFLKLNKAFEVPIGSIMSSPHGVKFRVTNCIKTDNYGFFIRGETIDMDGVDLNNKMRQEIQEIVDGEVLWPSIGLTVTDLKGANPCGEVTYVDQHIPPPLRSRVPIGVSSDDLLFGKRIFLTAEDENSRVVTTDEYYTLLKRQGRFQRLYNLYYHLKVLHKCDGDAEVHSIVGDCDHDGLPRNYQKERAFVVSMTECLPVLDSIKKFQSDVIKHVNPTAADRDLFQHMPLYPRDETTNEGMTLVSSSVHENCGLIRKVGDDDYELMPNAEQTVIDRRGRKLQLMDMAVSFFERKMEMRRKVLIKNIENISTGAYKCQLLPFEIKYKEMMASRHSKK
jgi:hypothetical protein